METLTAENRRYGTIADFNVKSNNYWEKRFVFVLKHSNPAGSVENKPYPNSFGIKLEDTIFDKKKGKSRMIRVVPGETSIYKDEQSEDGQKANPINKYFSKQGDLIVEGREEQTLEYLLKCNANGTNPDRNQDKPVVFGLLDNKQGLSIAIEKDKAESEASNWCFNAEFKNIVRYARVLGFDTNVDPEQLRHALFQLSKKDAVKFNDGLKNKYVKRKFNVLEAIDKGLITVDLKENTIKWASGNIITASPMGKNPIDHFVDLSCSTTDFDMTYNTLYEQVNPAFKVEKEAYQEKISSAKMPTKEDNTVVDATISTKDLIEVALKKGVIEQKVAWLIFLDKKLYKKKFYEAVDNDPALKESIIKACQSK